MTEQQIHELENDVNMDGVIAGEAIKGNDTDEEILSLEEPSQYQAASPQKDKGKFYAADPETLEIVRKVLHGCHAHLKEAKIGVSIRKGDWTAGDNRIPGKAKLVGADVKAFLDYDFILQVNEEILSMSSPEQKESLFDHLLSYCSYNDNEKSGVRVWKIRKPEIHEFIEVMERRGIWNADLKKFEQAYKQPTIWEASGSNEKLTA